ncbi:MAG: YciI family protein [Frankia sp.]
MKYMIMMFAGLGATLETRSPEWITGMNELLMKLDGELRDAGEVVASERLVDPAQATTVRFRDGAPLATDGPFAEVKEALAGYWVLEVSEERALEIASRVVEYTEFPMEVRRLMDMAPES